MAKSKVAQIKEQVKWQKTGPKCSNCKHYASKIEKNAGRFGTWSKEVNKRCSFGGFATGKSCWCINHEFI